MGKWGFIWKDPPFFMGKTTMSMAMFNSYVTNYPVKLPEGTMGKTMS